MSTGCPSLQSDSKFTKGEKCIFVHLILTFVAILVVVLIYFVHLCLVRHSGNDMYKIARTSHEGGHALPEVRNASRWESPVAGEYRCVGEAHVRVDERVRAACGAALLRPRWSLAPAHCVAARALPDLAYLLPHWRLRYYSGESQVRRGVAHPEYEGDRLACNVGLFEHSTDIAAQHCSLPSEMMVEDELLNMGTDNMIIIAWRNQGNEGAVRGRVLRSEQCSQFVSAAVEEPRAGEWCVAAPALSADGPGASGALSTGPVLGAAVFVRSQMVAISSWGDVEGKGFPLVVLHLTPYKHWLETTMLL